MSSNLINPNAILNRSKREQSADERRDDPRGSGPFAAMMQGLSSAQVRQDKPGQTRKAVDDVQESSRPGIKLGFKHGSHARRDNGVAADAPAARGHKTDRLPDHEQAPQRNDVIGGRRLKKAFTLAASGKGEETPGAPDWDGAQRMRAKIFKSAPGARLNPGMTDGKLSLQKPDLAAKAMALNGGAPAMRADGTPVMRDEEGRARVLGARESNHSLGEFLKEEASEAETKELLAKVAARMAAKKDAPAGHRESYVRTSEQLRADAPGKQAESVAREMRQDAGALKGDNAKQDTLGQKQDGGEQPKDDLSARDQRLKNERAAGNEARTKTEAKPGAEKAAKPTEQNTVRQSEHGARGDAMRFDQTLTKAARAQAAATQQARSEPVQAPITTVDAQPLATALARGDRPQAAAQLANLLGARIDYIANNARPQVRLQLSPQELGHLDIRLMGHADHATLRIHAERETVGRVMEAAANHLVQQLHKSGVQVDQVQVDYGDMLFDQSQGDGRAREGRDDLDTGGEFGRAAVDGEGMDGRTTDAAKRKATIHDGSLDVVV